MARRNNAKRSHRVLNLREDGTQHPSGAAGEAKSPDTNKKPSVSAVPQYTPSQRVWQQVKGPAGSCCPPSRGGVSAPCGEASRPTGGSGARAGQRQPGGRSKDPNKSDRRLHYDAQASALPPLPPWAKHITTLESQGTNTATYPHTELGFMEEVLHLMDYVQLNKREVSDREQLIQWVRDGVQVLWPQAPGDANDNDLASCPPRLVVYGSYALSLSLPSSDVDMTVQWPPSSNTVNADDSHGDATEDLSAEQQQQQLFNLNLSRLHTLADHLRTTYPQLSVTVREHCRLPILKIYHKEKRLFADINVSQANTFAVSDVLAKQESWLQSHAMATVLIMLTKAALRQWGTHEVFRGGLSSTALYSLVYRYLRERSGGGGGDAAACSPKASMSDSDDPQSEGESGSGGALTLSSMVASSRSTPLPAGGSSMSWALSDDNTSVESCCPNSPVSPNACAASDTEGVQQQHWPADMVAEAVAEEKRGAERSSSTSSRSHHSPDAHQRQLPSSVEALTAECLVRYGVSPARLLLNFWRMLSAEVFMSGYGVSDAFTTLSKSETMGGWTCSGAADDLTAASYRLPELIALFRHYSDIIDGCLRQGAGRIRRPWLQPSILSMVFVDPRGLSTTMGKGCSS